MKVSKSDRGFVFVEHPPYTSGDSRLVSESSAVGNYEDALDNPGSSYLWIGPDHHLDRDEVRELIDRLTYWLDNKRLQCDDA